MRSIFPTPAPPDWRVDWAALERLCPFIAELAGCPQDPIHHAEGDVAVHTRMVVEALAAMPAWRALPVEDRAIVFAAALLHDVAKPATTRTEIDGRISARGHSARGEVRVRGMLYRGMHRIGIASASASAANDGGSADDAILPVDPSQREQIASLVRWHQVPYFLVERDDAVRQALRVTASARADLLALVAEADARGRTCADQARLLDNIALFVEQCRELGCLTGPRAFPSDHSRFLYFQKPGRDPEHHAHDGTRSVVTLMCGLPAAGKDAWIARHRAGLPVVSLDDLRRALDVDPEDRQHAVAEAAEARMREHLRAGRSFVFNATNLARKLRATWIGLCAAYDARVEIVYVEVPWPELRARNRARTGAERVPERVIERMLERWEIPDATEAHRVEWARP